MKYKNIKACQGGSEIVLGTASLYQRISDKIFILITAASNFAIYEKNKRAKSGAKVDMFIGRHPIETFFFLQRSSFN